MRPSAGWPAVLILLLLLPFPAKAAGGERVIGAGRDGTYLLLSVGEQFNLTLGSSPSTGYGWQIGELDRSVVDVVGSGWETSTPRPGAGGSSNWTFEARRSGETTLRLAYLRSWQGSGSAAGSFSLHIVVGTGNTAFYLAFLAAVAMAGLLAAELARRRTERRAGQRPPGNYLRRLLDGRVAGALGLAGVLTVPFALTAAAAGLRWFSLWDNDLSELGVSSGAPWFNGGLIFCGVLGVLLAVGAGIRSAGARPLRLAGSAVLAGAMATLAALGIVTEAFGLLHFYFAVAFFTQLILASLVLGVSFAKDPAFRTIGGLALLSAALGLGAWFLPKGEGITIPELVATLPALAWVGLLASRMVAKDPA